MGFHYEKSNKLKHTVIPLEMTKTLIKSYLKDKEAAKVIENEMKALLQNKTTERGFMISDTEADSLKVKAQAILDKEKK